MSFHVVDEVPVEDGARVYAEGWQSWSPTTWYAAGAPPHAPATGRQHTMRFRPRGSLPEDGSLQGEGLLVVDPGGDRPSAWYAAPDADSSVPSLRATHVGDRFVVSADGAVERGTAAAGEAALAEAADGLARRAGIGARRAPAPRVWCTWYQYFERVTARDVEENLLALDDHGLPVDVVQVDDGWSRGLGAWLAPAPGFGSLSALVERIRATGRRAGIWLAPFLVGIDTEIARRHPDWLVGDAGCNWGQDLAGLDLTHPGVRDHLATSVGRLRELGIDYFKLDFLYAGALPGRRREDVGEVAAYRSGLRLLREAAGPEAYLVGCGAPVLPSVGLVDAMRVSPDTFHEGGEDGSSGLRGRMSLAARAWQHGRFWTNDPDCLVARPSYRLREPWAETVRSFGGLRSVSDRVAGLDAWGLRTTRDLLETPAPEGPFPAGTVRRGALAAAALAAAGQAAAAGP